MNDTPLSAGLWEVTCAEEGCLAPIISIPNRWWRVRKSYVTFLPEGRTPDSFSSEGMFDNLATLRIGNEEYNGRHELETCLLRILHCASCGCKLGVKCVRAPELKARHMSVTVSLSHFMNPVVVLTPSSKNCFFKEGKIVLRAMPRGGTTPLNIVASTADLNSNSATSGSNTPLSRPRSAYSATAQDHPPFDSFDGTQSAVPKQSEPVPGPAMQNYNQEPQQSIETDDKQLQRPSGPSEADQSNRPQPSGTSTVTLLQDEAGVSNHDSQLRLLLESQTASIATMMGAIQALQSDVTAIKESIARLTANSMLPPSITKRRRDLYEPVEFTDSSRESSRQREAVPDRPVKMARLKYPTEDATAAILRLRGVRDIKKNTPEKRGVKSGPVPGIFQTTVSAAMSNDRLPFNMSVSRGSSTLQSSPKGMKQDVEHRQIVDSIDNGRSSEAVRLTHEPNPSNASNQISRETQEYLDKAIIEDPHDLDYDPSVPSASASTSNIPTKSSAVAMTNAKKPVPTRITIDDDATVSADGTEDVDMVSDSSRETPLQQAANTPDKAPTTFHKDPLSSPAHPIESISQQRLSQESYRGRGGRRPGAGRPRKSMTVGDGRLTPEWERDDWDPEAYAAKVRDRPYNGQQQKTKPPPSKAVSRRGVSRGGLLKSVPSYTRDQFQAISPNPGSVETPRSEGRQRDAEGYILMSNGKRDGRSLRMKRLNTPRQKRRDGPLQPQQANHTEHNGEEEGEIIELQMESSKEQAGTPTPIAAPSTRAATSGGPIAETKVERLEPKTQESSTEKSTTADERARQQNETISANHAKLMAKIFGRRLAPAPPKT